MHLSTQSLGLQGYFLELLSLHPTFATATTAAAPEQNQGPWFIVHFLWDSAAAFGWQRIGIHLLLATVLSILLLWPCARKIAGPNRILIETTLFVGSVIALCAAFLALAAFIAYSGSIVILAAVGLVFIAILFTQTRQIFEAGRGAAAGVLGCFVVSMGGALYGTEHITGRMPWTEFLLKSREQQNQIFAEWRSGKKMLLAPAPEVATAAGPAPATAPATANPASAPTATAAATAAPAPMSAPPASSDVMDLQALYVQLQKARAELNLNDPVAVERFNVQAEAYRQEKALAAMAAARRQAASQTNASIPAQTSPNPNAIRK